MGHDEAAQPTPFQEVCILLTDALAYNVGLLRGDCELIGKAKEEELGKQRFRAIHNFNFSDPTEVETMIVGNLQNALIALAEYRLAQT